MLAVQPIANDPLAHQLGQQAPYKVPSVNRKDASHPAATRATGHYDIIDIQRDGLKYFDKVTYNHQYYLTNAEIDILVAHSRTIADHIEPGKLLLELGSGALRKTEILLRAIEAQGKNIDYCALDLDRNELARTWQELGPSGYRNFKCHVLLRTYDDGRAWLSKADNANKPKAILSLGSTIGGLIRIEATEFLRGWSSTLQGFGTKGGSQVIIGLDGNTHGATVWNAYNDFEGDNRRFIMNALSQANHDLGYEAFQPS